VCCPDLVNRRPGGRPAAEAPRHPLVVGMISRLAPWKGQDIFLRAFAHAFSDGDEQAVIVGAPLFGTAEVEYGEQLRRLVNTLDIAGRVEFRGHRHDIAMELGTMDVLVHASTIAEPFGQVVIEGMSARLAVVASHGGGPEEIITDGVDGLFHPPGDVAALSRILVRLGAEPELRTRLGRAAGLRADDFSPEVTAPRMMQIYNRATAGP
jgi:glycosyltransferase involved in cell wall biosynthesis